MSHLELDLPTLRSALYTPEPDLTLTRDQKNAAVAAIVRDLGPGPELLFIRRSVREGDPWSGQMAFPGGHYEPQDSNLRETALRETSEEIGLDLRRSAELLGPLPRVPAVARGRQVGLTILPLVFELKRSAPLHLSGEVDEALWAPLRPLLRGERATTHPFEFAGTHYSMPAHDIDGRIVWGLTYRMLETLQEQLASRWR